MKIKTFFSDFLQAEIFPGYAKNGHAKYSILIAAIAPILIKNQSKPVFSKAKKSINSLQKGQFWGFYKGYFHLI